MLRSKTPAQHARAYAKTASKESADDRRKRNEEAHAAIKRVIAGSLSRSIASTLAQGATRIPLGVRGPTYKQAVAQVARCLVEDAREFCNENTVKQSRKNVEELAMTNARLCLLDDLHEAVTRAILHP